MTQDTSNIHMLWKGKLFGTCAVSIFVLRHSPKEIRYDMQDIADTKHMLHERGMIEVVGTDSIDTIIAGVCGYIERKYIVHTLKMYTEEIRDGYKH